MPKFIFSGITLFFSLLIPFFFFSCGSSPSPLSEYGTSLQSILRSENGVFRGFNLGVKMDSVLNSEQSEAKEADENYLYYEYYLDTIGTYNITYTFDETGLAEIQSDIFILTQSNTDNIFNSFKTFFDEHYGPSITEGGYFVWAVKSDLYGEVKINLSNESADFSVPNSPGKVSILIYPDKE